MKKVSIGVAITITVLVIATLSFKNSILESLKDVITTNTFVAQDNDNFNPGIKVDDQFPCINATFNDVIINDIAPYYRQKGTIFVVSRSLVWCPYCMKQMIQLNENINEFQLQGWSVVGLTYDSPKAQQAFKDKYDINYPILSDNNAATVITLGILNEEYVPGDEAYGIGHPGAFIVNASGVVIGKVFLESYAKRVDAKSLLNIANSLAEQAGN